MSSESIESFPSSQSSAAQFQHQKDDIVHILNIRASTFRRSKVEEVLFPDAFRLARQEYIILIQKPTESTIMKIRSAYNMHPVIEYECNSSSYLKDHMIQLDDCLFLTLTDIPKSGELNNPASLKIIMMNSIMFLLIQQELHCIEEIFVKTMNFNVFDWENQDKNAETEEFYKKSDTAMTNYKKRFTIKLDLVEFYEMNSLEEILYKILHVMFMRIEEIVSEMDNEVKICNEFATELSTAERIDFVLRVHMAKKTLIYARNYVDSKAKLLPEIIESKFLTRTFNQYLNSMALNMKKLTKKIDSSRDLLKSSEHVHKAIVEGKLSDTSERSNDLLKVFSAITTICLPLNLVSGFFGMNIRIPFQSDEYTEVYPFLVIVGCSLCYLIAIIVLFRMKGWL
jgi:Mg2+ and Co2+ transporter CorA